MDTLCGIGLPELIILALLAFVLLGPTRTRDIALTAGRWLGKAMRSTWWHEFNDVTRALRDLPTTLVRMAELEEAQSDLQRTLREIETSTRVDMRERSTTADAGPEEITDPWGISQAAAGTRTYPTGGEAAANPEPESHEEDSLDAEAPAGDEETGGEPA